MANVQKVLCWSRDRGSNSGPPPYHGGALPTELSRHSAHPTTEWVVAQTIRLRLRRMAPFFDSPREQRRLLALPAHENTPCGGFSCAGRENRGQLTSTKRFARRSRFVGWLLPELASACGGWLRFSILHASNAGCSLYPHMKTRPAAAFHVRVGRIELPSQPWEGRVLPLNDTRGRREK